MYGDKWLMRAVHDQKWFLEFPFPVRKELYQAGHAGCCPAPINLLNRQLDFDALTHPLLFTYFPTEEICVFKLRRICVDEFIKFFLTRNIISNIFDSHAFAWLTLISQTLGVSDGIVYKVGSDKVNMN